MTFNYQFNEECEKKLLTQGIYKFSVIKSTPKISKSGNKMFNLTLKIITDEDSYIVFSFLIFAQAGLCKKNISDFCKSVNINDFEKNEYREDFSDLVGHALIDVEKDLNGKDRNIVKEWITEEVRKENKDEYFPHDNIPF